MTRNESERGLVLFDIDRTTYRGYVVFPLVETQAQEGFLDRDAYEAILEDQARYERGEDVYTTMVKRVLGHYAGGLAGKNIGDARESTRRFLTSPQGNDFYPYARTVIDLTRSTHDVYFVTGEPQFVGSVVTDLYEAQGYFSTSFSMEGDIFVGTVDNALSAPEHKIDVIHHLLDTHDLNGSFAFGDSEGDTGMLSLVTYPIAVNPTPSLETIARSNSWEIRKDNINEIPLFVASKLSQMPQASL